MKLDWNRVKRTLIQSAAGAGVALITAVAADFSKSAVLSAVVGFLSTVSIAVLMNIQKQADEAEKEEE